MVIKILYKTLIINLNNIIKSPTNRIRNQTKEKRGKITKTKATPLSEFKN